MKSAEPNLRIPAVLMPSFVKVNSTEEGKNAEKRVRVNCGICKETRYYSIYRGVTRIAGTILACEACRHSYQKFKRRPCILKCNNDGKCYVLGDNSKSRCKACWIAHILRLCPLPAELYIHLLKHLPDSIKERMESTPRVMDDIPEEERGAIGLEMQKEETWEDITEIAVPQQDPVKQEENDEYEDDMDDETLDAYFEAEESLNQSQAANHSNVSGPGSRVNSLHHTTKTEAAAEPGKWWSGNDGLTYSVAVSGNTQTYFNMSNMSASDGLTPLTPLQPADTLTSFTALAPMTPVEIPHVQHIQNEGATFFTIKQVNGDVQDGASQEARLFQNISIKQEYYQPLQEVGLQVHPSPYFNHNSNNQIRIEIVDQQQGTPETAGERIEVGDYDVGSPSDSIESIQPKKTKRKRHKVKVEENGTNSYQDILSEATKRSALDLGSDNIPLKQKKKMDRFDGMPEEEVAKKFLPDHLGPNMDILIIGINPGLFAAHKGHHYAGPGNHFWKCMYLSGLIPEPFTAYDDFRLLDYGIGFTNIVARTTRGSADLSREEIKKGSEILLAKLRQYQPLIAVFNGKGIYEIYSGKKQFNFGKQPEMVDGTNTHIWVMPSSSARCAQLPRALDKVPFYSALRKYRDFLKGAIPEIDEEEITFSHVRLSNPKTPVKQEVKEEQEDMGEPKKLFKSEPSKGLKALKRSIKNEETKCTIKSENPS